MVGLFSGVFLFAVAAMSVGVIRFLHDVRQNAQGSAWGLTRGQTRGQTPVLFRDILTLRHLHASGADCVSAEEHRSPWRRWLHHCTFYGFLLCFASTTVAAIYDNVFGWRAPCGYASLPVILGTIGGAGLLVGSLGLWTLRRRRDRALTDETQDGLDESFLALLFLTTLTGLALLVLRHQPVMPWLLIVHLGTVLALFVTLPYGKFVHGLYRAAALVVSAVVVSGFRPPTWAKARYNPRPMRKLLTLVALLVATTSRCPPTGVPKPQHDISTVVRRSGSPGSRRCRLTALRLLPHRDDLSARPSRASTPAQGKSADDVRSGPARSTACESR